MNIKTRVLTKEQYEDIVKTIRRGFTGCRPNARVATALVIEANLGLRISDIVNLRLCDLVKDGNRYHLQIVEQKTGKSRCFTVPDEMYRWLESYCEDNGIGYEERIIPISVAAIRKVLRNACDYLGYEGISTHSFRKYFATSVYEKSGFNVAAVQTLLQHSSPVVTQRYLGVSERHIEELLKNHIEIV